MRLWSIVVLATLASSPGAAMGALVMQEEEPLLAGAPGVPVPKRSKHVQPAYPHAAQAQGIRGIVILDLVVSPEGKVTSVTVLRSVPGLDEAAIEAARQWEYQPTRIEGRAVSVRITVPITFALKLPELERQHGIPELRQGVAPAYPAAESRSASVTAEVTLAADGTILEARVVKGDMPWSAALLEALRTWRFAPPPDETELSFRVEADFVPGDRREPGRAALRLTGLRASEPPAATEPEPPPQAADVEAAPPTAGEDEPRVPVAAATAGEAAPAEPPAAGEAASEVATQPEAPGAEGEAPPDGLPSPPVEVITAPPPPPPLESGISVVQDVSLTPGVPELSRGRRPVPPPLARIAGATGDVEVAFSVGTAGTPLVQSSTGPDLLKAAAEQTVGSWYFRRTQTHRLYLLAAFSYGEDRATAQVRLQEAPAPP